ncbi:MAG: DMT family transporter [bacterium]
MLIRILMLIAVCSWGWSFVATKIALEYLTPVELIGLRFVTALPVLLIIMLSQKKSFKVERKDLLPIIIAALIVSLHFFIQVTGIKYTSATNSGWIIAASPLALLLLSVVFLKEKLTYRVLLGVGIATVGILCLISKGHLFSFDWISSTGDWLVLASAFTWSVYSVLIRNSSRKYNSLLITFWVIALASIIMIGWMSLTSDMSKFLYLPLEPIIAVLFLGIVCLGISFWIWQEGVSQMGAGKAGIYLYFIPLFTTILAVPYLDEKLSFFTVFGGGLVLMGVYIAERKSNQTSK